MHVAPARALDSIGFDPPDLATIRRLIAAPAGLIVVAGPDGAGTRASVEAMLQARSGAADTLVIGQLAAPAVAQLALRAVEAGRLVLSRLRHDRACGVLTLLRNLGADPVRLADALALVIAQRLLPQLCPLCSQDDRRDDVRRVLAQATNTWLAGAAPRPRRQGPNGCAHEPRAAKISRVLAYEMFEVDSRARLLIGSGAAGVELQTALLGEGATLWDSGLRLLAQGKVSLEALRASIREPR